MDADIARLIAHLGLEPHPNEGGYFRETYRSAQGLPSSSLTASYGGDRSVSTGIFYLLTPSTLSAMHRVRSDEMFHFYLGDAVEQLRIFPNGGGEIITIGPNVLGGEHVQTVVPANVWQGARLKPGGRFALMGCTVAPGFDYGDYQHGDRAALQALWPDQASRITDLTPADPVIR